jgi:hypothetical protein
MRRKGRGAVGKEEEGTRRTNRRTDQEDGMRKRKVSNKRGRIDEEEGLE